MGPTATNLFPCRAIELTLYYDIKNNIMRKINYKELLNLVEKILLQKCKLVSISFICGFQMELLQKNENTRIFSNILNEVFLNSFPAGTFLI